MTNDELQPCIGTVNPPLTPPRRGTDIARTVCSTPGRGRGWVGSWKVSWCLTLLTLLAVGGFTSTSPAATFTASLDRSTISVDEGATMSLRFEGGLPADVPAGPHVARPSV